jgi:hypothetical protein
MMVIMSDVFTVIVLQEHNWRLIVDSKSIIDNSRVMLQLVGSFMIIIYDCHIFMVQTIIWQ